MAFPVPPKVFNALDHARNKAIESNQFTDSVLTQFRTTFEEFWGVSGSIRNGLFIGSGSRYSLAEMQSVIDALGAGLMEIMTQAAAFTQFLNTAYPGVLPARYQQAGFDYTIEPTGVVLTGVNAAWAATY
jgi:hypothetical protein